MPRGVPSHDGGRGQAGLCGRLGTPTRRNRNPGAGRGSGPRLQGAHVHTGQAEAGLRQLLARAVRVAADVQEEVASAEEEEGSQAGRLARRLHLRGGEGTGVNPSTRSGVDPEMTREPLSLSGHMGRPQACS